MTLPRRLLSELTYADLDRVAAWRVIDPDAEDSALEPAELDASGAVAASNCATWCLCRAVFADGSEHQGSAVCWSDGGDGPVALTVWNGSEDVPILLPPAPAFVLQHEGPAVIAAKFNRTVSQVFPIEFSVLPEFALPPIKRHVVLEASGRL